MRTFQEGCTTGPPSQPLPSCRHSKSPLGCLPGKEGEKEKERKEEETGGNQEQERMHSVCGLVRRGRRGGTPHSPTGATNAIFPPTHHSPLGGQSLAKLSTKIKLRCRFLPIALNRADWIRVFLFSSHLDHLGHWGPEGRLGPGGGGTEAQKGFPARFSSGTWGVSTPILLPRTKFIPRLCKVLSALWPGQVLAGFSSPLSIPSKFQTMHLPHQ